ncbi:MAG: hypothetical protein LBO73_04480 [Holosporaceae bacterium]|jgi:hypothetical protein|nr:hypothetical protein [Holosporaceae bacterium]
MKNISCCALCFLFVSGVCAVPLTREVHARVSISPKKLPDLRKETGFQEREEADFQKKVVSNTLKISSFALTDVVSVFENITEACRRANVYSLSFEDYKYELDSAVEAITGSIPLQVSENQKWFLSLIAGLLADDSKIREKISDNYKIVPNCLFFFDSFNRTNVFSGSEYCSLFNKNSLMDFYLVLACGKAAEDAESPHWVTGNLQNTIKTLRQVINYADPTQKELLENFEKTYEQFKFYDGE